MQTIIKHNGKYYLLGEEIQCIETIVADYIPTRVEEKTLRYTLPTTTTPQTYEEMKQDHQNKTYPQYAEWLFQQAGDVLGLQFDYPPHRDQINTPDPTKSGKGTVNGQKMIDYLKSKPNNLKILETLRDLIAPIEGSIPLGLDNEGKVIYAYVRSGYTGFSRFDYHVSHNCLVPSTL